MRVWTSEGRVERLARGGPLNTKLTRNEGMHNGDCYPGAVHTVANVRRQLAIQFPDSLVWIPLLFDIWKTN